ncbi:hypothetical protein ACRAWF_38385 [Streptomyces sp. L7]
MRARQHPPSPPDHQYDHRGGRSPAQRTAGGDARRQAYGVGPDYGAGRRGRDHL